jgi:transposase
MSKIATVPGLSSRPWLRHLFADSAYNGPNLREALAKFGDWTIEIVKRAADAAGFQLLPRRWVVERTLAWLNRNRRLAKDFEASIASAKAWGLHRFRAAAHQEIRLPIIQPIRLRFGHLVLAISTGLEAFTGSGTLRKRRITARLALRCALGKEAEVADPAEAVR